MGASYVTSPVTHDRNSKVPIIDQRILEVAFILKNDEGQIVMPMANVFYTWGKSRPPKPVMINFDYGTISFTGKILHAVNEDQIGMFRVGDQIGATYEFSEQEKENFKNQLAEAREAASDAMRTVEMGLLAEYAADPEINTKNVVIRSGVMVFCGCAKEFFPDSDSDFRLVVNSKSVFHDADELMRQQQPDAEDA